MSFKHMKTIIDSKGNTVRQSKINDGKLLMANQLMTDPSYNPNMVLWQFGVDVDKLELIHIKTFDEKYSAANGRTIQFNTLIDTPIVIGDMVYDKKKDIYWICNESYDRDEILCAGKMVRCNYTMKWQDDNKNIFEYPVFVINSTQYNSGVAGNKTMVLGTSQHLIAVTADEHTIALNYDKRLFLDRNTVNPTVSKITQNDTTAMNYDKGILRITVTEDQYNPKTDSIENWLCDYFQTSNITITYSGKPTIRVGGTKTLRIDTTETVVWSVESDIGATIVSDGNSVKVKCANNIDYVGKTITVKATVGDSTGKCLLSVIGGA